MYRMMIVDDECLSRYVFKTLVSRNIKNIQIVGEAENGRQAIEMNRKLKPDIIIMDIKMPGINGIDASREIINEFPKTRILILTAYDNFDYIKSALDIGVKGYILKPVKEEEAVEKINKVIKDIEESNSKGDFKEYVEKNIKVVRPFIESELISSFIIGSFDIDKVKSYISFLQEKIEAGYFMLISPGNSYSKNINESLRNKIIKDKVYSVAEKFLPLMRKCFFGNCIGNTVVVFFPVEEDFVQKDITEEAVIISNDIKRKIKVIEHVDVGIGIGRVYTKIEKLYKSYNEANYALQKAVCEKKIVHFDSVVKEEPPNDLHRGYSLKMESNFIEQIKIGNIKKAKSLVDDIISGIMNNNTNISTIREYIGEFIMVLKRAISEMGFSVKLSSTSGILFELGNLTQLEEIEVWCRRIIYDILEQIDNSDNRSMGIIRKVFEYVNKNYYREITLDLVAQEVGLTPQYLSKMFKEKYGTNFIDYVTKKRIEYAEELLKNDKRSIKEISKLVGYEDSNYFCKLFKKDKGLTPKQYRMQKTIGEI